MLEFYYDFLEKFVEREDFQLFEMDADSLYLALNKPTLVRGGETRYVQRVLHFTHVIF